VSLSSIELGSSNVSQTYPYAPTRPDIQSSLAHNNSAIPVNRFPSNSKSMCKKRASAPGTSPSRRLWARPTFRTVFRFSAPSSSCSGTVPDSLLNDNWSDLINGWNRNVLRGPLMPPPLLTIKNIRRNHDFSVSNRQVNKDRPHSKQNTSW